MALELFDIADRFFSGGYPWWVYALLVLFPLIGMISAREALCWFWKINKVVDRLERIEARLHSIQLAGTDKPQFSEADEEKPFTRR